MNVGYKESRKFFMHQSVASNTIKVAVLRFLAKSDRPSNAREIALALGLNYNSVRSALSNLNKEGRIARVYRGFYSIKPMYGVGEGFDSKGVLPRVHNVRLVVEGVRGLKSSEVVESVGGVKFRIVYGSKRGKLSCVISCSEGLDFVGFSLAIAFFKRIVEERFKIQVRMKT